MAIVPYRVRVTQPGQGFAPPPFRTGTTERFFYTMALMVDALQEKRVQATFAHIPANNINMGSTTLVRWASDDALAAIGQAYGIARGLTEGSQSYGTRLQHMYEAYRFGGMSRGMLQQILEYLLALTPMVRATSTIFDPSTFPPTRGDTAWDTYPAGRPPTEEPIHVDGQAGRDGDLDWDSASPVTGSYGSWGGYVIVYSVAPNAWCQPAQAWGSGSTYTGSGYYSTVTSHAYGPTGSYTGASQVWGAGTTYTPSANGAYSTVSGNAYVPSGVYQGGAQGWGVSVSEFVGRDLQVILEQFKPADEWIRCLVVCFDATLFDPTQIADGIVNPNGTFGQWSLVSAGAYAESRFVNAVYGGDIV